MNKDEVLRLSKLARIEISPEEAESLSHEFDAILGYVGEVKAAATGASDTPYIRGEINVVRDDANPHESGIYTEKILNEAPQREGQYVKVKKIL